MPDSVLASEKTRVISDRIPPRDATGGMKGKGHDLLTLPVSSPVHETMAKEHFWLLHSDGLEPQLGRNAGNNPQIPRGKYGGGGEI